MSLHSQWRCCRRPCLEDIWHTKCNSRNLVSYSHSSRISGRTFNIYSRFIAFFRNVALCFCLCIETNVMFMYRIASQIAADFKKNAVLHTDVCCLWWPHVTLIYGIGGTWWIIQCWSDCFSIRRCKSRTELSFLFRTVYLFTLVLFNFRLTFCTVRSLSTIR